jgi:hypothetical protein
LQTGLLGLNQRFCTSRQAQCFQLFLLRGGNVFTFCFIARATICVLHYALLVARYTSHVIRLGKAERVKEDFSRSWCMRSGAAHDEPSLELGGFASAVSQCHFENAVGVLCVEHRSSHCTRHRGLYTSHLTPHTSHPTPLLD